jgi:hypothetical protein
VRISVNVDGSTAWRLALACSTAVRLRPLDAPIIFDAA